MRFTLEYPTTMVMNKLMMGFHRRLCVYLKMAPHSYSALVADNKFKVTWHWQRLYELLI